MYSERTNRIQQRLEAEGLDALLVTNIPNIYYLSGFTGSTAQILITRNNRWFLTDFRYHVQFETEVEKSYSLVDNTGMTLVKQVIPALEDSPALQRIGFESPHVPHSMFTLLAAAEGRSFVPTSGWVEDMRVIKDAGELERIRVAVALNERIFVEVLSRIQGSMTEADLAAEIVYLSMKYGASGVSFRPIVASGPNSSKPHAGFSRQRLVPDTPLTFDMGMLIDGYCSDMTRTVFYKSCTPKWESIYNIVREAKDAANSAVAPGKLGKEIDAVARDVITAAGYGDKFGHGLGHGVGIEVHEAPRLAKVGEQALLEGMVCTNEPGIYLPGEGGIRIEDMFVVTGSGAENLNSLPTDIQVVG